MTSEDSALPSRIHCGCLFPSSTDYFTQLLLYPGGNAREPWGLHGTFTLGGVIYSEGREAAVIAPQTCDERGHLQLDFESPVKAAGGEVKGFGVLVFDIVGGIPAEIYLSHIHRKSGVYFAY